MLEHMLGEKQGYEQRMAQMSQELQTQAAAKEDLNAKVQRLYSTLSQKSSDKAGIDRLFTEVMNEGSNSQQA